LLADKFNLVFARHWANYQELVTLTREGKNAFDRPGFRPGYARRETKKGLDRFCRTFEANEKAMPQIQKGLVDAGWPPMTTLKIPWVLG
jgi:hypothetical protein